MALHFWAALGAARKAGSKVADKRKPPDRLSMIVGGVIAALAVVGVLFLEFRQRLVELSLRGEQNTEPIVRSRIVRIDIEPLPQIPLG